ncbi:hypothetical protein ACJJIW_19740 [Microbulbifer sp. JMSA004]|uniref:hypothetical protein n=1 Tax=unclassified Microbulbifer TaxID=2619833 RepID=UPI0024AE5EF4|nr:hypothetical protein [Microbulbifer sp. VAAF005]WHI46691.1 hypothetical protein P0078_23825 [Microbulbifer sp. VAAF005]
MSIWVGYLKNTAVEGVDFLNGDNYFMFGLPDGDIGCLSWTCGPQKYSMLIVLYE